MRLTRRGYGLVVVILGSAAMGLTFGPRALNAIVGPGLVALGAALVQVYRAGEPSVERLLPAPGHPGERRTMRLRVDGGGVVTVADSLEEGLEPASVARTVTGAATVEYDFWLRERGVHRVGPASVTVRDALGLAASGFDDGRSETLLVYPRVESVAAGGPLAALVDEEGSPDREAFDRLREYVPGDALRDIHWKSSAKRSDQEFVVVEFADRDEGGVTIAAEAAAGEDNADEMAAAAASVALHLLDQGVRVGVVAPNGRLEPAVGDRQRQDVLELLARAPAGGVSGPDRDEAEVRVFARDGDARLTVFGREYEFSEVVRAQPGGPGVATAAGDAGGDGDGEVPA
jgi:uncharacterized protein (DUF58 family)